MWVFTFIGLMAAVVAVVLVLKYTWVGPWVSEKIAAFGKSG